MAVSPAGVARRGRRGPAGTGWSGAGSPRRSPAAATSSATALLAASRLHAEADAVAGRHAVREPARRHAARRGRASPSTAGIEGLVGVEVDHAAAVGRQLAGTPRWPRRDRRRGAGSRRRRRPRRPGRRGARARCSAPAGPVTGQLIERHDLQVDQVAEPPPGLDQRLPPTAGRDRSTMSACDADGGRRRWPASAGPPARPVGDVVGGERWRGWRPSPRWRRAGRRSGWGSVRRGTPCRGGRGARRARAGAGSRRGRGTVVVRPGAEVGTDRGDDASSVDGDVRRACRRPAGPAGGRGCAVPPSAVRPGRAGPGAAGAPPAPRGGGTPPRP